MLLSPRQAIDLLTDGPITILALGRGVGADGELSYYGKERVEQTMNLVERLLAKTPYRHIQVIWTGGMSRVQVKAGDTPTRTEAEAMCTYATERYGVHTSVTYTIENTSITTIENLVNSQSLIVHPQVVIVTDKLHYLFGRVRFLAWLVLPRHRVLRVALPSERVEKRSTPKRVIAQLKRVAMQFISTAIIVPAMFGVRRGEGRAIMARQGRLESVFGVR